MQKLTSLTKDYRSCISQTMHIHKNVSNEFFISINVQHKKGVQLHLNFLSNVHQYLKSRVQIK